MRKKAGLELRAESSVPPVSTVPRGGTDCEERGGA